TYKLFMTSARATAGRCTAKCHMEQRSLWVPTSDDPGRAVRIGFEAVRNSRRSQLGGRGGQIIGTSRIDRRKISRVSGRPTLKKSKNRYFPGPYTIKQEGSSGVRKEQLAATATIIAKVRGLAPSS